MSIRSFTTVVKALAAFVACFALLLTVGCSNSPATLEKYYEAHPDQLQQETEAFENALAGADFADSSIEIKDNRIILTAMVNFNFEDFDTEAQRTMIASINESLNTHEGVKEMVSAIKKTEDLTGIDGITITVAYTDINGNDITSVTYGSNGVV